MKYQNAIVQLGLEPSDCVYVASSSLSCFWNPYFVRDITESLMAYFKHGTIVMPAFSSDFRRSGVFDVANSVSICGNVSEYFRKLPNVSRSAFHHCIQYAASVKIQIVLPTDVLRALMELQVCFHC